jgi:MoaA/NifB/PqqE/SkfB family radical SAM enzyme
LAYGSIGRRYAEVARQVRPPFVIWNFTNICSLKCKHCYQNAGSETTPDELSFAEKMTLIDSLVDAGG